MFSGPHSEESKKKISKRMYRENNPLWKGDKAGRVAIHAHMRRLKPVPDFCEKCGLVPPKELSNISGKYLRIIDDWWYLCIKCHRYYDDTIKNLELGRAITNVPKDHSKTICTICNSRETYIRKTDGYPDWYLFGDGYMCAKCYAKEKRRKHRLVKNVGKSPTT